jgi:ubiquinone/menaquinone biosynthesis C-methylase UbiE
VTARNWYDRHVLPYLIDFACGLEPIGKQREKVVPLATGRVLEVGFGSGLNLGYYDKARVQRVVALDPALEMHRLARKRVARSALPVELVGLSAERVTYPDASFDTVVVTYSLCSIPDPAAALREMRRVLKPGAKLLFCEHGLAPDEVVRRWQRRLNPLWSRLGGGCRLDRDVPALLGAAGFRLLDLQAAYLPGPRPVMFNYWGSASI